MGKNNNEHKHAFLVWNTFEMKMMKNYNNLCLKCDDLLTVG